MSLDYNLIDAAAPEDSPVYEFVDFTGATVRYKSEDMHLLLDRYKTILEQIFCRRYAFSKINAKTSVILNFQPVYDVFVSVHNVSGRLTSFSLTIDNLEANLWDNRSSSFNLKMYISIRENGNRSVILFKSKGQEIRNKIDPEYISSHNDEFMENIITLCNLF